MEMAQVKQAAEKARHTLSARKGVLGVGHGLKRTGGKLTEIPCVVVYVAKKAPMSALSAAEVIPRELDGVPTDVVEVKTVNALTRSTGWTQWLLDVQPQKACADQDLSGNPGLETLDKRAVDRHYYRLLTRLFFTWAASAKPSP